MHESVGIRELRHNLRRYLRRVARGEQLTVTDRGRAVAVLAPLPEKQSVLDRLIAEGRATAPKGNLLDLGLPRVSPDEPYAGTKALEEQRAERDL